MKKLYILLKDTPELKVGAILEELSDDDFSCINFEEHKRHDDQKQTIFSRKVVMENPEWFEEIEMLYLTKKQLAKVKKLLK